HVDVLLPDGQLPGGEAGDLRYGSSLDDLQPLAPERIPGTGRGCAAAHHPVDVQCRGVPVDAGVLDGDLGGEADALGGLRYGLQGAVLDAVHGRGEQAGTGEGKPGEQVAAGVGGADLLGDGAVDG